MNPFIIKMLVNSIGIENITGQADTILQKGIEWAEKQPLEMGETNVIGILYHNQGIVYYAAVTLDENSQIKRYLVDKPVSELIKSFIAELK